MKTEYMYEFIVLAHYMNFTTASANLHVSQPNLSKHIAEVEQELGVELFQRGKSLKLTPAGAAFLEDSIQIHHQFKEARARCRDIASHGIEELVIQEPFIIDALSQILYKSVIHFKNENPYVIPKYHSERGRKSIELLEAGSIDIALTIDCKGPEEMNRKGDRKNLIFYPVIQEPLHVWMHKDHFLADKKSVTLDDLLRVPINMTATRSFDPIRFAVIDLFERHFGKRPSLLTFPSETLNEFFMNTHNEKAVFLVSPAVASSPLLSMQRRMTSVQLKDERARITSYLVIRDDYEKKAIDDFLEALEQTVETDIDREEGSLYLNEIR